VLKCLQQPGPLCAQLGLGVQVLEGTPTAYPEVGTARHHPIAGGLQDLHDTALVEAPPDAAVAEAHLLPRQGPVDAGHLALHAGDTPSLVVEKLHVGANRLLGQGFVAACHGTQARPLRRHPGAWGTR
jgi:hypothetical protein